MIKIWKGERGYMNKIFLVNLCFDVDGHGKIMVANDELDDKKINFYKGLNDCFF